MNRLTFVPLFAVLGLLSIGLSGCLEDKCDATRTYVIYEPVFVKADEFRLDIKTEGPREMVHTGRIYYYQDFLFINEYRQGIHIINNRDPRNPERIAFIKIPGNENFAVRNNVLYADNYIDLITLDISNPSQPKFLGRTEEVFPSYGFYEDFGHLIYYEPTEKQVEVSCKDPQRWDDIIFFDRMDMGVALEANVQAADQGSGGGTGIGGSLARFTIVDKYLYSVSNFDLKVFDLSSPAKAVLASTVNIGWGIETIFPYKDNLFIGANDGMYIFDNSNPLQPTQLSVFQHARACDPVFVDGNIAYVTLRDGTACQTFNNQLDVVDVTDLRNPKLLRTYSMQHPHGLSVADKNLFICEGKFGLKVFDASEWDKIGERQLTHLKGFSTFDLITLPGRDLAMVIGEDGLYQFDISDPADLKELSVIRVSR